MGPAATNCLNWIEKRPGLVPVNNTAAAHAESEYRAPLPPARYDQGVGNGELRCRGGVRFLNKGVVSR